MTERTNNPPCDRCGGPHEFDTSLPSPLWNEVIRAHGEADYLCLSCIVSIFARWQESFPATLWGQGFDGLPIEVRINERESRAVTLLTQENTQLRARLTALGERVSLQCRFLHPINGRCKNAEYHPSGLCWRHRPAPPAVPPKETI